MKVLHDTVVLLGRSMRHILRSPDTIITVLITPIMIMLLFVYVLGGAIQTGDRNYVNYLLPGILLIAIASGIAYTALRLFNAISVVVIILIALIMGFRSSASVVEWLEVAGILVLFTLALTWLAVIAGL